MKIVVLDGYTLNPGDLDWGVFREMGEFEVYDRTPRELVIERAKGAEILLTNKTPLPAETLSRLPQVRYIGVLATGYNVVDVAYANERGIVVTNVPAYGTHTVAQFTFALLLELCSRVQLHDTAVHAGEWTRSPDFCFTKAPLVELYGKTLGIIGFGSIGRQVARIGQAFGMRVATVDRGKRYAEQPEYLELSEIFRQADVISVHCPLTPETEGLICKKTLERMKPSAFLINTSRGGLVVERDLADALNEGRIAGAGLDVLSTEPPAADNPLLTARNCIITPHIAWATKEARERLMNIAADNLRAFLEGRPQNTVSAY